MNRVEIAAIGSARATLFRRQNGVKIPTDNRP